MNRSLELPEAVYTELVRAAEASGTTPAGWIQKHLPKTSATANGLEVGDEELTMTDAALGECLISLGHPVGIDNEQIDADLAREYGGDDDGLHHSPDE